MLSLTGCYLGVHEGLHVDIAGTRQRFRHIDQRLHRKPAPRNDHRPGFNTAVAVDPLLHDRRHTLHQVVDADLHRLLNHAIQGHGPGTDRQRLGGTMDVLVRSKLIEVVVGDRIFLFRDRALHRVFRVAIEGIER